MVTYKEAAEMTKTLMSVAGLVIGVIGIMVAVASYLLVSPLIDKGAEATLKQIDSAVIVLDASENTVGNLSTAMDPLSMAFKSAGDSLVEFSESLNSTAAAFEEISTQVPADQRQSLVTAANDLRRSSSSMNATGSSFKTLYNSLKASSDAIKQERADISKSKRDVAKIKADVREIFASVKNVFLIAVVLFALIFLAVIAQSFVTML